MASRLVKWLIFSVVFGLMPLLVTVLLLAARRPGEPAGLLRPIEQGELLLIAAALCGGACGDLIGTGPRFRIAKLVSGGGAVLLLFFSAAFYASIVQALGTGGAYDPGIVATISIWTFGLSVFTCAMVVVLSESE